MAKKRAEPPFKPIEIQVGDQIDLIAELKIHIDDQFEADLSERFKSMSEVEKIIRKSCWYLVILLLIDYAFIAAEHQSSSHW